MLEFLIAELRNLMTYSPLGFVLGTLLSSSVVPIPSESILLAVGLAGINPVEAAIYGGIGSALGAIAAYWIGKYFGSKLVKKVGKYFFLTKSGTHAMKKWSKRFGSPTVLLSRLIPIVPHKIFSIVAGMSSIDLKNFLLLTFMGSVPRCFFLVYFGNLISALSNLWLVIASVVVVFVLPLLFAELVNSIKS